MKVRTFFTTIAILVCTSSVSEAQQPIALHPDNPHYFQYKGKPLLLVTSAEHYGALLNLDFDYNRYFDELASERMNLTRTFTGVYCEPPGAFNIGNNTLAPLPNRLITPWARSSEPGYKNGGNKFDLTQWDPAYFERLKSFMQEADKRDIMVEFTLFCPFYEDTMWVFSPLHPLNNVNSTPDIPRTDVYTTDKSGKLFEIQKALVRKLVTELNGFNNIIFEICNEPYFGGVTMEWQHAIADVIIDAEKSLPKKHLISQNIANATKLIENPHPNISVFNFHYAYPPVAVAQNYHLNKPIGDNETGFNGSSDSIYRFEGWRFMLAGGALYNNLDYSFTPGHEAGDYKYNDKTPGGGSDALRKQLGYLRKFMERFNFLKMSPDSLLIDPEQSKNIRYNAISEKGNQYAVYLLDLHSSSLTLNIPDGRYEVQWMHPLTGKYEKARTEKSTNNRLTLEVPAYKEDLALRIVKKN